MDELTVPPLLAHPPEASPPWRRRLLLLPVCMAIVGILIATAAAISGQDSLRAKQRLTIQKDAASARAALLEAQLHKSPPDVIENLERELTAQMARKPTSYTQYGRQFTEWDGWRYEEIIRFGYAYHQPDDPLEVKASSFITEPGQERRVKNVVWYPLYPMLGWMLVKATGIAPHVALTVISQLCTVLAAIVLFLYARRHYYNRMPKLMGVVINEAAPAATPLALAEQHPTRRWDLTPQDTAALWALAALLYGPCSIFLYANFTESLFVFLLALFLYCLQGRRWWQAAAIAAVASSCRAQGALFAPVLALVFLLRSDIRSSGKRAAVAVGLGAMSLAGLLGYMVYLQVVFGDPLAFAHAQNGWNVGIHAAQIFNALNPMNALMNFLKFAFFTHPMDWPRLWEAFCVIWPPIMLLILGGRFLSFELECMGWLLWGLPYVSSGLAGDPMSSSAWMSMGRFMAVMVPAQVILGAVFARFRWAGVPWLAISAGAFALFAYMFGAGVWVG